MRPLLRSSLVLVLLLTATATSPARAQFSDWEAAEREIEPQEQAAPPEGAEATSEVGGDPAAAEASEAEAEGTAEAAVEDEPFLGTQEGLPDRGRFGLSLDGTLYFGTFGTTLYAVKTFVSSPIVGVSFLATDRIVVGAQWPFAAGAHSSFEGVAVDDGDFGFRSGNPYLYGDWRGGSLGSFLYTLRVGVGIPVVGNGSTGEQLALAIAAGSRGFWDAFLWLPKRLPITFGATFELEPFESFTLALEAGLAGLKDVSSADDGWDFLLQLAADGRYGLTESLGVGLRFQMVIYPELTQGATADDNRQSSVMPYADLVIGRHELWAGLLLNLDQPYSSFDEGVWSLRMGYATSF